MANAIDLTTLNDVKSWLGLTDGSDDVLLVRLITAASHFMQQFMGRDIVSTTYNDEVYHGNGSAMLTVRQFPIISIAGLSVDGVAISDFSFDSRNVYLKVPLAIGMGNVKITYTAGFATVPFMLQQAAIELVSLRYREKDRIGHSSKQLGGETVSFIVSDMTASIKTALLDFQNVVPA